MAMEKWVDFFKSEVRSAGQAFVNKGQVALMRPSDTELQAYIRTSTSFKVQFRSPSIESPLVTATCNCTQGKKGNFCKHIWATMVVVEEKNPDFFSCKTELTTSHTASAPEAAQRPNLSQKQIDSQAAYKLKQADYRKQQYQRQKERAQKFKKNKSPKTPMAPLFPDTVAEALRYFSENGFVLADSLSADSVGLARKKLARVFHPDLGGSHDEILQLNRFTEILIKFCES
jgi:uncharacterized Zn finger protein